MTCKDCGWWMQHQNSVKGTCGLLVQGKEAKGVRGDVRWQYESCAKFEKKGNK